MRSKTVLIFIILFVEMSASCSRTGKEASLGPGMTGQGLNDYYSDYFIMGVSVSPNSLDGDEAALIKNEFSSLTAENVMKMGPIHPEKDVYRWEPADAIVTFASKNNMKMRGHALCWHNQTPSWLFTDFQGDTVSSDTLLQRLHQHISHVADRYKKDIYAWDVVNEAISDAPGRMYRDSPWFRICGKEYIAEAFRYAREADPDALLFYNDYEVVNPAKRTKIYEMIRDLLAEGVPVDGIGIQGHWSVYEPEEEELTKTIQLFSDLGLVIHITELDISVYKKEHQRREKRKDDTDIFTAEMEQLQTRQYAMIFRTFREFRKSIGSVTFWNVSDRNSWLDNFPVPNRKDYPLLFDDQLKPKPAYDAIVKFNE